VTGMEEETYRTGLGLGDQVATEHGGLDSALLDGGRLFETVRVNTPE